MQFFALLLKVTRKILHCQGLYTQVIDYYYELP